MLKQNRITNVMQQCDFPKQLLLIKNPPKKLHIQSQSEKSPFPQGNYIAMVGTRRPSSNAKELCKCLVKSLANTNAVIVSGLAQGIDSYCHEAALDFGLKTIAVLAQGLETRITGNRGILAKRIVESGGALVTEYESNTPSHKGMFPARNRIIAALSETIIVVESASKGGSLITADYAQKFGKRILAVPGDFYRETAQGPLQLLRQGIAEPIFFPEDLCGICGLPEQKSKTRQKHASNTSATNLMGLSKEASMLYSKYAGFCKTLSELNEINGITASTLFAILTELELSGLAHSNDGFRYCFEKG